MAAQKTLILRSVTAALKAKDILAAAGISVTVVKQSNADSLGCAYGIRVSTESLQRATQILLSKGILQ